MLPETSSPLGVLPMVIEEKAAYKSQVRCDVGSIEHTRKLEAEFNVKQGDDLSLPLGNVNIPLHTQDFINPSGYIVLVGREDSKLVVEVFLGPFTSILVNPVPVVGIVENHCGVFI